MISIAYFIFTHIIQVFPEKYELSKLGSWFHLGGFLLEAGVVGRESDAVVTEITDKEITTSSSGRRGRRRRSTHYYVEVEWQGTQRFSVPAQYYNAVEIGDVVEIGIGESLFGIKYLNLQE